MKHSYAVTWSAHSESTNLGQCHVWERIHDQTRLLSGVSCPLTFHYPCRSHRWYSHTWKHVETQQSFSVNVVLRGSRRQQQSNISLWSRFPPCGSWLTGQFFKACKDQCMAQIFFSFFFFLVNFILRWCRWISKTCLSWIRCQATSSQKCRH